MNKPTLYRKSTENIFEWDLPLNKSSNLVNIDLVENVDFEIVETKDIDLPIFKEKIKCKTIIFQTLDFSIWAIAVVIKNIVQILFYIVVNILTMVKDELQKSPYDLDQGKASTVNKYPDINVKTNVNVVSELNVNVETNVFVNSQK